MITSPGSSSSPSAATVWYVGSPAGTLTQPTRGVGSEEFEEYATNSAGPIQAQAFKPPVLQYKQDLTIGLEDHVDR